MPLRHRKPARQARLREFGEDGLPDPPLVILDVNAETVYAPGGDGKVAGHIGVARGRDGKAYVSRKNPERHRYWKGGGYALSRKILKLLMRKGVHHLLWYEHERNRVLEFGISDYKERGRRVKHAPPGDPQVYVPDNEARHVWLEHAPILDARS